MSPLTFYVQNTIWIFTPFYWVRLWASYIFLSPFYWVRYEANYIFLPLFIGSDMSQITFSTPFLLGQKWVKLHFLPLCIGSDQVNLHIFTIFIGADHGQITYFTPFHWGLFCDFHTLWHCVKCSFNTLKKRLIFHTLDYWCLMDKLGLRSWPKYFEQKIRFLHRMEFYLQQRI